MKVLVACAGRQASGRFASASLECRGDNARGHVMFSGAWTRDDPTGLAELFEAYMPAARDATPECDFHDCNAVEAWATSSAKALGALPGPGPSPPDSTADPALFTKPSHRPHSCALQPSQPLRREGRWTTQRASPRWSSTSAGTAEGTSRSPSMMGSRTTWRSPAPRAAATWSPSTSRRSGAGGRNGRASRARSTSPPFPTLERPARRSAVRDRAGLVAGKDIRGSNRRREP